MNQAMHSDKHTVILDAAQKRFARFGVAKVTMEEIAADLGMSKPALYYYFKTKEEIFRQVIAREQAEFLKLVETITTSAGPASSKLQRYFKHHVEYLNELLNLKLVCMRESEAQPPVMHDLFREFAEKETNLLEAVLLEGKKQGEFIIDSAEKTSVLLWRLLFGLRMRFLRSFAAQPFEEIDIKTFAVEIALFSKIFIKGISR
jgi:TetR/AcrR family transcriptional regulator